MQKSVKTLREMCKNSEAGGEETLVAYVLILKGKK